jgi:hypothetical protein
VGLLVTNDLVTAGNSAPTWTDTPSPTFEAGVGGTYDLQNNVFDQDGDTITFALNGSSAALPTGVTLASNGTITATTSIAEAVTTGIIVDADDGTASVVPSASFSITGNASTVAYLSVIPGVYSYGCDATFGRGNHTVYHVTSLSDSGAGTLREACGQNGDKVIVFDTSGMIELDSDIRFGSGACRVAGETAPAPGIWIWGACLNPKNDSEILITHITSSVADDPGAGVRVGDEDSIRCESDLSNLVIHKCTFLWGLDETASIWLWGAATQNNLTFSQCIISEAMHKTAIVPTRSGKGLIIGNAQDADNKPTNVSVIKCLFSSQTERNPLSVGAYIANNLVYNISYQQMQIRSRSYVNNSGVAAKEDATIVGNVFKEGPKTNTARVPIDLTALLGTSEIFVDDNLCDWITIIDNYDDLVVGTVGTVVADCKAVSAPFTPTGYVPLAGSATEAYVLANVGARPAARDAANTARLITEATNGVAGGFKDAVIGVSGGADGATAVVGGKPTVAVNTSPLFTVPASPNVDSGNGYTNLEVSLQAAAAALE